MFSLVEGNMNNRNKGPKAKEEEENIALVSKGKEKKDLNEGHSSKGGEKKNKDLSKVKCFICGEFGHYVT